jgi:hypothetical protein
MALKSRTQTNKSLPTRKPGSATKGRAHAYYGRAGTGKTTLFGTFPGPALLLDLNDRGDDSVSDVKDLQVMDITDPDDLDDAYWYLKRNPGKFKSVALDTVTQLQQMFVEQVSERKKVKRKGATTKNAGDWGTMTKQDWGEVAALMKNEITRFRDLPMEVVFLAQDRVFGAEEDDMDSLLEPEVGPRLSPSVNKHLCAAVHIIGNTFLRVKKRKGKNEKGKVVTTEKIVYCLRVGPNPVYTTKVRKPKEFDVPEFIENPTYDDIIDIVNGD